MSPSVYLGLVRDGRDTLNPPPSLRPFPCAQLALEGVVYLVDAVEGGVPLVEACRAGLESPSVIKVIHDCRRDAEVHSPAPTANCCFLHYHLFTISLFGCATILLLPKLLQTSTLSAELYDTVLCTDCRSFAGNLC